MDTPMDKESMLRLIGTLRKLSGDVSSARTSLSAVLGQVGDAWQGPASAVFLETNTWTVKDMERLRFEMEDLAGEIEAALAMFGKG